NGQKIVEHYAHTHRASENLRLFKGFSGYGLTIPFNGHFEQSEKYQAITRFILAVLVEIDKAACFTFEMEME
ncbi:hypothetical protein, partial [Desulfobulbus sp.]|uniref:hypothetical protein n=1 Tax=Desulfobulbus sp. TaxID=895 RepID=UPI0027B90B9A